MTYFNVESKNFVSYDPGPNPGLIGPVPVVFPVPALFSSPPAKKAVPVDPWPYNSTKINSFIIRSETSRTQFNKFEKSFNKPSSNKSVRVTNSKQILF